jgi:two-component system sensor histidine kinase UhpB
VQLRVARKTADPATAASLETIADQLAGSINELRMLAQGLRPPALDMIGLSAAIQAHARNVTETGAVRVDTRIEGVDGALQPESELALYRLIQEALLNVVRHSRSDQARVEVERNSGHVVATVADEGRGFDVDDALVSGALGLFGMHERASYVGGRVTVRSAPGQGTRVRIEIPLRETTTWPTPSAS